MIGERVRFPVAVHLFLLDGGSVLLQRRFQTGYEDGNYSVVAGHVDGGEDVYAAMIREAREEAGINIRRDDLEIVQVMHRWTTEDRIDYFFACRTWTGKISIMEPDKCDELRWAPLDDLPANMVDYVEAAIQNYKKKNLHYLDGKELNMKKTILRKYAKLAVKTGVNLKKGQGCVITAEVDQFEFVRMVEEEAYRAGAKWVTVNWMDQPSAKLKYRHENLTTLSKVQKWEEERQQYYVDTLPALIHIVSADPDGLKGVNIEKMQKSNAARTKVLKKYRDAMDNLNQWTIVAVPSKKWAKKVFPGERTSKAMEMLWDAILKTVRVDETNDPVEAWNKHNASLKEKHDKLNSYKFDYLHYESGNGTDFKCWLIPEANWMGGGDVLKDGTFYNPNMPTEEVFTSPMKGKCEGTVVSTMPLSYQGNLIDRFSITFEDGKAVSCKAEQGEELLKHMIAMDEGAAMLGELALVPDDSPISNSGILYYNTLFDENASCHIALGMGFDNVIENYEDKTKEELHEMGINDSIIHVDFMIGSKDLNITGYTKDGKAVKVFTDGNWAI